jgi:hypothetical protein
VSLSNGEVFPFCLATATFGVADSQSNNVSVAHFSQQDNQFAINTAQEHQTMERMAEDTGGHAFINTNGLDQAVAQAITEWKGNFRKIQVKLDDKGYKLSYRRGYFADDPNSPRSAFLNGSAPNGAPGPNPMQAAMQHGAPAPSEILFKVRVIPASSDTEDKIVDGNKANLIKMKGPFRRYSIDFGAVPGKLLYVAADNGTRKLAVEFVTLVYTPDGTLINSVVDSARATLTPAGFATLQRASVPTHQEVSVPAHGDFFLRLGIRDLNSGHIGATEIPLTAVKDLPPLAQPTAATPSPAGTVPHN